MKIDIQYEMMKMINTETIILDDNTSLEQVKKCVLGKLFFLFPDSIMSGKINHNHVVLIEITSDKSLNVGQKSVCCATSQKVLADLHFLVCSLKEPLANLPQTPGFVKKLSPHFKAFIRRN